MSTAEKFKIVISDCHLSAGRMFQGRLNPHEDFHFDEEMCEFFEYFSTGKYGEKDGRPVEVELFINGDFLDFLNVPDQGEFHVHVNEKHAVWKLEAIFAGHPEVMGALKAFAAKPGKTITYLLGNHDTDLAFPGVKERITREWDPNGQCPSEKVKVINDTDRVTYPYGVEIRHGNQLDSGNEFDLSRPIVTEHGEELLNHPWSSVYVLKVINRLKWEREYIDKVRPIKIFAIFGLFLDPVFTARFLILSAVFFVMTRLSSHWRRQFSFRRMFNALRSEIRFFRDLEREAHEILETRDDLRTIVFGHTHRPMTKIYPNGKQYINTGTWTRMINMDWAGWGQEYRHTFALVTIRGEEADCELRQWNGNQIVHKLFNQ